MELHALEGVVHVVCSVCVAWGVGWGFRRLFINDGKPLPGPSARLAHGHISKGWLTPWRSRRDTQNNRHGPGLDFLPDELIAKIKQHLSQLDWDCYRAACSLPLSRRLTRHKSLDLGSGHVTRQERALLSDPLVRKLFVGFSVRRADGNFLQKLRLLSNLESLDLFDCGLDVPIRCMFHSLTCLSFWYCTLDASGCPAISTLRYLYVKHSKVLLSGAGHPFPLVSQDAHSLYILDLDHCEIVDVAGNGQLHIDAPQLEYLHLTNVSSKTRSTTCSLAGARGLPRSLCRASLWESQSPEHVLRMDPMLLDAFRRQILPQLTLLSLHHIPQDYLPLSLPALRSLEVYCPGKRASAGHPCQARQYPRQVTSLKLRCWGVHGCSLEHALEGVAKAGLQLRKLDLDAGRHEKQTCTLRTGAFEGLKGTLEELRIETGKVGVGVVLGCLQECARLTDLKLSDYSQSSSQRSDEPPVSIPADFLVVAMPMLQKLEIPMPADYFDLQACPRLHSLHITDTFDINTRSNESPPLASIIVGLRKLSKLFKMPDGGRWASPKGYSTFRDAHWHKRGSSDKCYSCSPAHTVWLGT